MPPSITWAQALAWRLRRHHLTGTRAASASEVARDLCGVQAQVPSAAEAAIRVRLAVDDPDAVAHALPDGALIRTWAMRGTLHLLTPEAGPAFLALMAAGGSWRRPSWQRAFGATPEQLERLRQLVREALLADGPLTREELIAAVTAHDGHQHLGDALRSGWGTLLKPIAWQGDLCHGPLRGRHVTFQHPSRAARDWPGLPDPDIAAPIAISAYLRAYGPASLASFAAWMAGGVFGARQLKAWGASMGDRLATVEVDGTGAVILSEDLDDLRASRPTDELRLLPGFDQWVLGPGTGDPAIIAPARRSDVSRTAGWIAPVVVRGGRVVGTWEMDGGLARVAWFTEAGQAPRAAAFSDELERWSAIAGRPLDLRLAGGGPPPETA